MQTSSTRTRPRAFGFDEQAELLKQTARKLLRERCSNETLHRLAAASSEHARARQSVWDRELWAEMVELGWPATAVPEADGGFEMPLVAVAGLAEEIGRVALPSPLLSTLSAAYVLRASDTPAAHHALARIAEGASATLAMCDRHGSWTPANTEVTLREIDGRLRLDGSAHYVQDAAKSEFLIVVARDPARAEPCVILVEAHAPGVTQVPDAIIDLTRDQARVDLRDVEVAGSAVLAGPERANAALAAAEPAQLILLAADMVGAAEWQLQTTSEYARTRVQFDRPLGFFQAVKHPLVDMMLLVDQARSLVYDAACSFDHEPALAEQRARMAKSAASDAAAYCSSRSVQLHGGIGFTWECFVHLYFKRQHHSELLLGDGRHQRARLADMLIGPASS